ncbi:MAG: transcriptional repressor [Bacillota bacterium]
MAGKRITKQKRIILEVIKNTNSHPTADWIYEQAKKQLPDISLGTVYRNLKLLASVGEIMELNYGSTYSRYDGVTENHYHFVCRNCGTIYDLDIDAVDLNKTVASKINGKVEYHRLEFYGTCCQCQ